MNLNSDSLTALTKSRVRRCSATVTAQQNALAAHWQWATAAIHVRADGGCPALNWHRLLGSDPLIENHLKSPSRLSAQASGLKASA